MCLNTEYVWQLYRNVRCGLDMTFSDIYIVLLLVIWYTQWLFFCHPGGKCGGPNVSQLILTKSNLILTNQNYVFFIFSSVGYASHIVLVLGNNMFVIQHHIPDTKTAINILCAYDHIIQDNNLTCLRLFSV